MANTLLIVEMRRLGLSSTAAATLSDTWANAAHHIKTKYGISTILYKNSLEKQLFGPGQGSTLGPFLWLLLFTLIVKSIEPHLPRISLATSNRVIQITDVGEAFVDDSFLGCTSTYEMDPAMSHEENKTRAEQHTISGLSQLAQQWERLLFSTGGAICLNKSFLYLISWQWSKQGIARLCSIDSAPGVMKLTSGWQLDKVVEVPRIEATSCY
jgi:hypothetical protein